jgi:hypothetical protein
MNKIDLVATNKLLDVSGFVDCARASRLRRPRLV